ncbi:transglycosylase SLT domain-containing protein [Allorhizobium sp. BGMRC 0089]|uniref:transglycosylase SLT domain-containing protein n=1 Tax=Allorhizobium sonneratiae TaxID=2934936 RepID=UPI0020333564|nr:transglycosylase SLT domain-containing protein [Allorhizobium sonneratiae]MCM2294197.1 transglycosylase SLT domain-containing protein [Allorhizobium sonneratiae]
MPRMMDRAIALSVTTAVVAALSSCTTANETAKADLAPKPAAIQKAGTGSAVAATQTGSGLTQTAVTALTSTPTSASGAERAINLAAGEGPIPTQNPRQQPLAFTGPTVASVQAGAVAPGTASSEQPIGLENEALQPDVVAIHNAVPVPRPQTPNFASTSVAVAIPAPTAVQTTSKTGASMSFAMLDAQFDTSAPVTAASLSADTKETLSSSSYSPSRGPTIINSLVDKYAALYNMPPKLIHRVIYRESRYNPGAYRHGNYGLMQIRYNTAKAMGYDGPPKGLFDPETNLKYAIKYLRGAWMVAENNNDNAVRLYAKGYYTEAKSKGMDRFMQ